MTRFELLQKGLLAAEGLCALVAILYYPKVKHTYWKYFALYCMFIFAQELFSYVVLDYYPYLRRPYFDIIGIPVQFLFLFWLFAKKALQLPTLFVGSVVVYLAVLIPHFFYISQTRMINELSYTVGCLLLLIMGVLEFRKQIQSDDIIHFKDNKMFYINIGVMLFYIGSMPFYTFDESFYNADKVFWKNFRLFFLITDILMYLLFTASILWGKTKN